MSFYESSGKDGRIVDVILQLSPRAGPPYREMESVISLATHQQRKAIKAPILVQWKDCWKISLEDFNYSPYCAQCQLQAWDAYKQSISEFWITESWTPEGDKSHWVLFEESDKQTLRILLAFMAAVVKTHANCTLFVTVVRQVKLPEAQHFFAFQSIVQNIHREALAMIMTLFSNTDKAALPHLLAKINMCASFRSKVSLAQTSQENQPTTFAATLFCWIIIHGLSCVSIHYFLDQASRADELKSSFYNLKRVEADRESHTHFASLLFHHLDTVPDSWYAHAVTEECVQVEIMFARDLATLAPGTMNHLEGVTNHIKFAADTLLWSLRYPKLYNTEATTGYETSITGQEKAQYFSLVMEDAIIDVSEEDIRLSKEVSFREQI